MIPILSFSYVRINKLEELGEILLQAPSGLLENMSYRYSLFSDDTKNKYHHDCPIMEFVKSDILSSSIDSIKNCYQYFIDKYGKEKVNLLIPDDESTIKNKILYTINFAMEALYDLDTIRIEFFREIELVGSSSSIPNLIYSTIEENFDIIDQCLVNQPNYVTIKRRK